MPTRASLDAWDLVMRALSHYWRMTREDNMAAQRLLILLRQTL